MTASANKAVSITVVVSTQSAGAEGWRPFTENRPESPWLQPGDEWPLVIPMPGCYPLYELWLSPWGIMAWGTTPGSSRLQPGRCHVHDTSMRKTFKYRLCLNKQQQRLLDAQLEECRWLYNELLAARRDAWEQRQESLRLYDQQATLPLLKVARPALAAVQSQVLQNVAVRIDLAFQAFFRRVRPGEGGKKPGFPRFRGQGRYDSITFPQVPVGCKLDAEARRLRLHGVGQVKIILHRPLEGTPKTATISRSSTGKWYACFSCDCVEPSPLPATGQLVGIDVGLKTFATLSTGQEIVNPRFFRQEEKVLAKVQRRLSNEEQGTPERMKRRKVVARVHERIRWRRSDFTHQHSRRIANAFDLIAVEDLAVNRMTHTHCLAKSIHDAAWSQFTALIAYKAAWAGRQYVAVNPAYTSQDCSACGHRHKLSLSDRIYTCPCCGIVLDRDYNASLNMLRLGQQSLASV
jgi:putative transposase